MDMDVEKQAKHPFEGASPRDATISSATLSALDCSAHQRPKKPQTRNDMEVFDEEHADATQKS